MDPVKSPSIFISKLNDVKKKRNIDDYDQFDEESNENEDMETENILHTETKETPAQIHDNARGKFYHAYTTISYSFT